MRLAGAPPADPPPLRVPVQSHLGQLPTLRTGDRLLPFLQHALIYLSKVRACVRACVCACVLRACVRVCVRVACACGWLAEVVLVCASEWCVCVCGLRACECVSVCAKAGGGGGVGRFVVRPIRL